MRTLQSGKLAKASLHGRGQGEGLRRLGLLRGSLRRFTTPGSGTPTRPVLRWRLISMYGTIGRALRRRRFTNSPSTSFCSRRRPSTAAHFDPNQVQLSRLLSIKTGGCPEDCAYCSQSAHYSTGLSASKLMEVERVIDEARKAKAAGATRYCMGAAWRSPKERDLDVVCAMVRGVKALGMETCMTLGMLTAARRRAPQIRGPRLLQPQHRHLRALL